MKILSILILATTWLFSGCASIVSQSSWPVNIKSTPDQAKFTIINEKGDTVNKGTTPSTVILNSGAGYFDGQTYYVKFSHEGYKDSFAVLNTELNGWYWGNFLFGGLTGLLIIDPATGAMWKLPESINQDLMPNKQTIPAQKNLIQSSP
jgi:uncharacterized protein YceK